MVTGGETFIDIYRHRHLLQRILTSPQRTHCLDSPQWVDPVEVGKPKSGFCIRLQIINHR